MEEGDHPSPEEPEPAAVSEDGARRNARTYDCTFCKRGFSNAQALGGHMNIHRKDRAKIKQPPNLCHFPLNPFTPANYLPLAHGGDEGSSLKWPQRILGRKEDGSSSSSRELPLFIAPPSQDDDDHQTPRGSSSDHQISRHRKGAVDLDLELRLGTTEPRES